MVKVTFREAWTYRTPETTIDYLPGEQTVTAEIAEHARAERVLTETEDEGGEPIASLGPLDQSVPDLISYLDGVDDLEEVAALIEAEEAGKTRSTALAALNARKAALEA